MFWTIIDLIALGIVIKWALAKRAEYKLKEWTRETLKVGAGIERK